MPERIFMAYSYMFIIFIANTYQLAERIFKFLNIYDVYCYHKFQ